MDDYFPIIDENIDPCKGCPDHTGPNECASNGGCAKHTNADRIRTMSDEELAAWHSCLAPCCHCEAVPEERNQVIHPHNCYEKWLDWLKQEEDT